MKNKSVIIVVIIMILAIGVVWKLTKTSAPAPVVYSFEECVSAGNPVTESYPRQCRQGEVTFVENIGNLLDKANLIRLTTPLPNQVITSPLTISGEARGTWFFEASFPVFLTDWDGRIIAQGIATAKSDWMTADFVPFEATLTFTIDKDTYSNRGSLILKKDNPSGLPEHDDALEIPVIFAGINTSPVACTMEAKLCPDGSYVGRTGPKCEFTACPSGGGILPFRSGVEGIVTLGPTCGVVRDPPDPQCADKPYVTSVEIFRKNNTNGSPFATTLTNKEGQYTFSLPPGEYTLQAVGGQTLPSCGATDVTVAPDVMSKADLSCDTGIR